MYRYLTNLPVAIPPGIIAMHYKARWLKNHLDLLRDWNQAIARLTEVHAHL